MATKVKPADLRDNLIEEGRYFVSSTDLCQLLGVQPKSLYGALHRPAERNEITNVCPRGWVTTPVEYQIRNPKRQKPGLPPLTWYIDGMMAHLGHEYYIGHHGAAQRWGMAHHWSPNTPVVTTARSKHRMRGKTANGVDRGGQAPTARYIYCNSINSKQRHAQVGPDGWLPDGVQVLYSSREATLLDLVQSARTGPAVDRACDAACLLLLMEQMDIGALADQALAYPIPVRQRAGRLVDAASEHMAIPVDTGPLAETLPGRPNPVRLFPHGDNWPVLYDRPDKHKVYLPWKVEENGLLDPDV